MRKRGLAPFAATMMVAVLALLLVAGCSGSEGTQRAPEEQATKQEQQATKQEQQATKQEQQATKQEQQATKQEGPNQEPQVVIENDENVGTAAPEGQVVIAPDAAPAGSAQEGAALEAVIAYYEAAELGDYAYTYDALDSAARQRYSYDGWLYANEQLDTAASEFVVFSVEELPGHTAQVWVGLTAYLPDGSSFDRYTRFVYENGAWRHALTMEEYGMFDSVLF